MPDLIFGVRPAVYKKPGGREVSTTEVVLYNEYGTEKIPPRPAFRRGVDEALATNKKLIQAQLQNFTRQILTGRKADINRNMTVLLTQIGKSAKAATVRIIRTGDETPNAPSTIAKKGRNAPWRETDLLMENVDYEVRQ